MSAFSTIANSNNRALSLPTFDNGADSNSIFPKQGCSSTLHRVVVMDDEDSRECPSQGACEIAREDFFLQGFDERRGYGDSLPLQQQTIVSTSPRFLQNRISFHRRVVGLCRQNSNAFRERRDSNSFDAYDSDSDDESILHHRILPMRHQAKKQLPKPNLPPTPTIILDNGSGAGNNPGELPLARVDVVDNNRNKRKTPSPIVGEEPAPVSVVAPSTDSSMDTSEDGTLQTQETCDTTEAGYDSSGDNSDNMLLPSPGRRVSLSPISRRLAIQFDSISFLSPVKPSRAKRRKTLDTSASCLLV